MYKIKYSDDYKVHDLSAESILGLMRRFISESSQDHDDGIRFLVERLGYDPDI